MHRAALQLGPGALWAPSKLSQPLRRSTTTMAAPVQAAARTPLETIELAYKHMLSGSSELYDLMSDDISFTVPGRLPMSGVHKGKAAVQAAMKTFSTVFRYAPGNSPSVDSVVGGNGPEVAGFGTSPAISIATGKAATLYWCHRWRVDSGMIVSFLDYIDTAQAHELCGIE